MLSWVIIQGAACLSSVHGHGAYHDVVSEISQALERSPEDAALRFKLACAHQEHGEWTLALAELERVDRLAPGVHGTGFVRGQALAAGNHWQAAKGVLDQFLQDHAGHAGALVQRGRVLLKLQKPEEAGKDFEKALGLQSNAPVDWWLDAAQAGDAVGTLRRALNAAGSDPQLLSASLDAELKAGSFDEALQRLAELQRTAPRPEPWMARRAEVLQAAGRAAEARAAWTLLRTHLLALPNLERGTPLLAGVFAQTEKALGAASPAPVIAPPKS
jgi:tetratricopeptide (TPR) repeat protein